MKRRLILSLAMVMTGFLGTNAQNSFLKMPGQKPAVTAIEVSGGIRLTLVPVSSYEGYLKISSPRYDRITVKMKDSTLIITGKNGWLFSQQVPVYVGVMNLKRITATDNSNVYTDGTLNSPNLHVFIDNAARVSLKTRGNVYVYPTGDNDVRIARKSSRRPTDLKAEIRSQTNWF